MNMFNIIVMFNIIECSILNEIIFPLLSPITDDLL